jgi:hypothetical protein
MYVCVEENVGHLGQNKLDQQSLPNLGHLGQILDKLGQIHIITISN